MNNKSNSLEDTLPKNCCTFCSHLSLEGPDQDFKYHINCIVKNIIPNPNDCCEFFDKESTQLTVSDFDNLYLDFLETSLRISYKDYLNSIYWKLFKEQTLKRHNYRCCICDSNKDVDVYHLNDKLGRETSEDIIVLCTKCVAKNSK